MRLAPGRSKPPKGVSPSGRPVRRPTRSSSNVTPAKPPYAGVGKGKKLGLKAPVKNPAGLKPGQRGVMARSKAAGAGGPARPTPRGRFTHLAPKRR